MTICLSNSEMHLHRHALSLLFVLGTVRCSTNDAATKTSVHVNTTCGTIVGSAQNGVVSWLGIPFAAPPIAERRWQPPVPIAADDGRWCWNDTLIADEVGPSCPQKHLTTLPNASEDCLRLHVWAPVEAASSASLLPVIVYLHGGSLVEGDAVVSCSSSMLQALLLSLIHI